MTVAKVLSASERWSSVRSSALAERSSIVGEPQQYSEFAKKCAMRAATIF